MSTVVGLLAGALTTGCFVPQLLRSWRTRSTGDFSWLYLVLLSVGMALWLLYGIMVDEIAVILTNIFSLMFLLTILGIKATGDRAGHPTPTTKEHSP